jgi:hypothetical protein
MARKFLLHERNLVANFFPCFLKHSFFKLSQPTHSVLIDDREALRNSWEAAGG